MTGFAVESSHSGQRVRSAPPRWRMAAASAFAVANIGACEQAVGEQTRDEPRGRPPRAVSTPPG